MSIARQFSENPKVRYDLNVSASKRVARDTSDAGLGRPATLQVCHSPLHRRARACPSPGLIF